MGLRKVERSLDVQEERERRWKNNGCNATAVVQSYSRIDMLFAHERHVKRTALECANTALTADQG
ncbi:hypothetical protein ACHAP3_009783 [Botrytis cinerea]